jgi:3-deoxy-7-phosphoheptulonate synthase
VTVAHNAARGPSLHTDAGTRGSWSPVTWRDHVEEQRPPWPDEDALEAAVAELRRLPPLVSIAELDLLTMRLADAAAGRAFVLHAGDCAESFRDASTGSITDRTRLLAQLAEMLASRLGRDVVTIGRLAGQYVKPRSAAFETIDGRELPAFRGHMVNHEKPEQEARAPEPSRLIEGYFRAGVTLNFIRAQSESAKLWTSHEAILLPYEEALARWDEGRQCWFSGSAHFLWLGYRTRSATGAHAQFLQGVTNPLGLKVGPNSTPDEVLEACELLDPGRQPGRLSLIARLGAAHVGDALPAVIRAVERSGRSVTWICDPMHGNATWTDHGIRTRPFDRIVGELHAFWRILDQFGLEPGGLSLEVTPEDVTECVGGPGGPAEEHLGRRYTSLMDPRLNSAQALAMVDLLPFGTSCGDEGGDKAHCANRRGKWSALES